MNKKLLFLFMVVFLPSFIFSQINYVAIDSFERDLYAFKPLTLKEVGVKKRYLVKLFNQSENYSVIYCKVDSSSSLATLENDDLVKNFYVVFKDSSNFLGAFVSSDSYAKGSPITSYYIEFDHVSGELVPIEGRRLRKKYSSLAKELDRLLLEMKLKEAGPYSEIYNR